jgi:hypothetical protein
MRLFIKIYADDFKGPCTTYPLQLKGTLDTMTIGYLKQEIENQVKPKILAKNQILSIKRAPVIVSIRS